MTPDLVTNTINDVLSNPKYKENARITQALINDHLAEPKDQLSVLGEVRNSDQWS